MIRVGQLLRGNISGREAYVTAIDDDGSLIMSDGKVNITGGADNFELIGPVPLDWTKPVITLHSRRPFIFNSKGYGRADDDGRQMWYGWLDEWAKDGTWYYEDGTPARGTGFERLINAPETTMIDPARPIQTTEREPRLCRTVGVLERTVGVKTIMIEVPYRGANRCGTVEIDLHGKVIGETGSALGFINTPKRDTGFWPLRGGSAEPYGRGMVSLSFATDEYRAANHFIEIVREDGVPVEAKIHAR